MFHFIKAIKSLIKLDIDQNIEICKIKYKNKNHQKDKYDLNFDNNTFSILRLFFLFLSFEGTNSLKERYSCC